MSASRQPISNSTPSLLELQLAESTRLLASANKELESFSYSVAHDLRSPLRTIEGFSQALLEDCGDQVGEVGQEHLQRIRSATQRMGTLIDSLLLLSRVMRTQLTSEKCDLSAIADSVVRELHATQPERQITWHIQPEISAIGDPPLLRLAIENLFNNAWKFTSARAAASIEFGKIAHNGRSTFFVKDDGAGFDPAYADRLFGTFQRLHSPADFPGIGAGLAIVKRIIDRHGGQVRAESSVGRGATLFFTLPQPDSEETPA